MKDKILDLRQAVGIILAKEDGKIWTGKRKIGIGVRPNEKNLWQMPQGGIDQGESAEEAAFRELEEETGSKNAKIIMCLDDWLQYDLPDELIGKALGGKYKGQKQKWFLMLFKGKDSDFNLNRSISACMVAQKKISESFDPDKAREYCKEEIKKKIDY